MKKLLATLFLCVVCAFCLGSFTACDINDLKNSVNEIINGQTQDEENNEENNKEENTVINKDTDFDALEGDKVEKDVFINAFMFFYRCLDFYSPAHENCTIDMYQTDGNKESYETVKVDGLKVIDTLHYETIENPYIYDDDNNIVGGIGVRQYENMYLLLVDTEYYIEYFVGNIGGQRLTHVEKQWHPSSDVEDTYIKTFAEKAWESAVYNEITKQYEISQIEGSEDYHDIYNNVQIKIKDGYIVLFKYTQAEGHTWIKCYDIGTTVVDIPADILAEMNAAK